MEQAAPRLLRRGKRIEEVLGIASAPVSAKKIKRARFVMTGGFLFCWAVIFLSIFSLLYWLGWVPGTVLEIGESMTASGNNAALVENKILSTEGEEYITATSSAPRIIIPSVGLNAEIVIPASAEYSILNTALYRGPVYFPGSGTPGKVGNVFIFGHSARVPVRNQSLEVFNVVKALKPNDIIRIQWEGREYWYNVTALSIANADDAHINFATDRKLLTLSTCRIVGEKEQRFVIEAELIRSYPLKIVNESQFQSSPDTSSSE